MDDVCNALYVPCISKMVDICKCFLKNKKARVQFVYLLVNRIVLLKIVLDNWIFGGLDASASYCRTVQHIHTNKDLLLYAATSPPY